MIVETSSTATSVATSAPQRPTSGGIAVRGSSLMLVGRVLALGLNFLAQVLIVRYLSKSDYGAFAYALSLVMVFKGIALLGLPDTVVRYLPVYRERSRFGAMLGTLTFATGAVVGLGMALALGLVGVFAIAGRSLTDDPTVLRLTIILSFLIPLEALNDLLTPVFAVFTSYRSIFLRKWVLAPAMRIGLVVLLMAFGVGVVALALGYLVVSAVGVLIYLWMLLNVVQRQEWSRAGRESVDYPIRELLVFAIPMMITSLVWLVMETTDATLLGYFGSAQAVADFRSVLPVARLTQVVILSFAIVYTPLAARAFARGEDGELSDLYWQTSAWICVLTFPLFLLPFAFARPVTIFLFGDRYSGSAPVMALLSLAYFIPSALGFNGATLKVYRKLGYSLAIDAGAATFNLGLSFALVPRWGPVGAATATCVTMCVYNVLRQYGLRRYTPVQMLPARQLPLYLSMVAVAALGLGVDRALGVDVLGAFVLATIGSAIVTLVAVRTLHIETAFPELLRLPMMRTLLRPFTRPA